MGLANLALGMKYRGDERTSELLLTQDMIRQLAFEAQFRNMSIGEFVGELLIAIMKRDLFQHVLLEQIPSNHRFRPAMARCSGDLPPPSPPAEKTTARQDQAGKSGTGDGAGDCQESPHLAACPHSIPASMRP
jgi:hypothetical protein